MKQLPQNIDSEKIVLSALLVQEAYDEVSEIIASPDLFYQENAKRLFEYIQAKKGKTDMIQAMSDLTDLKDFILDCTYSTGDFKRHAAVVVEKAAQREILKGLMSIQESDPFEMVDKVYRLAESASAILNHGVTDTGEISELIIQEIKAMQKAAKEKGIVGKETGFLELNKITGGWQNSDLIIVAARPAMGKTAFMMTTALSCMRKGIKVGIASLEMSSGQLTRRVISSLSEIELGKIRDPKLINSQEWQKIYADCSEALGIYLTDTPALKISAFRAWAKRMKTRHDVGIIIVDYLQLMRADAHSREQEISEISRGLKQVAKELNIPIIALAQLNREVEKRADKRPMISDLRESGAIEQDADLVSFLYRPAYYGLAPKGGDQVDDRYAELIIAKHRNGSIGVVELNFYGEFVKFVERDRFNSVDDTPF